LSHVVLASTRRRALGLNRFETFARTGRTMNLEVSVGERLKVVTVQDDAGNVLRQPEVRDVSV
jgi:hypothetical protein